MSCSLCRLPFTPDIQSVAPYPPPPGIMTEKQFKYFTKAIGFGERVPSNVLRCEYLDQGLFGAFKGIILNVSWKSDNGTLMMFHTVCAHILRRVFNCEENTTDNITNLCAIEHILGRPVDGRDQGRFLHVKYEDIGVEKVDVRPYQYLHDDFMRLDWVRFKEDGFEWTYSRPDTFPRFHTTVARERFPGPAPDETHDILTTKPLDILQILLPYLSNKTFVTLLSTCRTFRHHALTTFQPHARQRVFALGWAVPLRHEYAFAPAKTRESGLLIDPDGTSVDGDWALYLCSVHKSKSMRARRWIWATAEEIHRVYLERKAVSGWEDTVVGTGKECTIVKSPNRLRLEKLVATNPFRVLMSPDS